jgi:hypothetical protein
LFRLTRDGKPASYLDIATSILITVWHHHDPTQIRIEDGVCEEITTEYGSGAVKFDWQGVNWANIPAGLTHAKVVVTLPTEIKTYPTESGRDKMIIDFKSAAP